MEPGTEYLNCRGMLYNNNIQLCRPSCRRGAVAQCLPVNAMVYRLSSQSGKILFQNTVAHQRHARKQTYINS